MALTWDTGMSVEVREIDEQHKNLIKIMNTLYDVLFAERNDDVIESIFADLVKYAQLHFYTEEKYFDKFEFSGTSEHKIAHDDFEIAVNNLYTKFKAGEYDPTVDLVAFLEQWLTEHLLDMDKKYVECFHAHGLH